MLTFLTDALANLEQWVDCDNLSVPKRGYSSFYNTYRNGQIFNACILVTGCPIFIYTYFLVLHQKHYGEIQNVLSFEYFQNELLRGECLCGLHTIVYYEAKQNTSGLKQFFGRFCYKLQFLEVPVELFVNS
jgi:hypothetical protein